PKFACQFGSQALYVFGVGLFSVGSSPTQKTVATMLRFHGVSPRKASRERSITTRATAGTPEGSLKPGSASRRFSRNRSCTPASRSDNRAAAACPTRAALTMPKINQGCFMLSGGRIEAFTLQLGDHSKNLMKLNKKNLHEFSTF